MTIPESLAAIAQADPELVAPLSDGWYLLRGTGLFIGSNDLPDEHRAIALLWAYEAAARRGLDFAVAQVAGEHAGVCGPHRSEGHADPTAAALAALAAALTTTEEETT